jgi:hypothetical protein
MPTTKQPNCQKSIPQRRALPVVGGTLLESSRTMPIGLAACGWSRASGERYRCRYLPSTEPEPEFTVFYEYGSVADHEVIFARWGILFKEGKGPQPELNDTFCWTGFGPVKRAESLDSFGAVTPREVERLRDRLLASVPC